MIKKRIFTIPIVGLLASVAAMLVPATAYSDADSLAAGKALAFERTKGNCLACHAAGDGQLAGTIGPPLVDMKQRFSDKAALRAQIWDATVRNPRSMMPPFGRHRILTEEEIDLVVDYIYTL